MVGQKHQTKHGKNAKKEVRKTIRNKLDITDNIEIDRCHLMGRSQRSKSKPQTVVCKFYISKINTKVFKMLKS